MKLVKEAEKRQKPIIFITNDYINRILNMVGVDDQMKTAENLEEAWQHWEGKK